MPRDDSPRAGTTDAGRRQQILDILRAVDVDRDVTEIAAQLEIHPNTVRFHLENLVATGQVERAPEDLPKGQRGQGRPRQLYRIAAGWDPLGPRDYLSLAGVLLDHLRRSPDADVEAVRSGRDWGARIAAGKRAPKTPRTTVTRLVTTLEQLGFRPQRRAAGSDRIDLRHCPFQELADDGDRLVCRIHLGMLEGIVETWDAPVELDGLDPLVDPGRCVVRLRPT